MANDYSQFAKKDEKNPISGKPAAANKYAQFTKNTGEAEDDPYQWGRDEEDPWHERLLRGVDDFGLNLMDSLTFGGYNKLLQGTGLEPQADAMLEESRKVNPITSIAGQIGGYVVPGGILSKGVGNTFKALSHNTLPSIIGREAVAGGLFSAFDDVAREGRVNPVDTAIDATLSGAGAGIVGGIIAGGNRIINPGARARALGSELSEADKLAAFAFADNARNMGIPLTAPEAIGAVAPTRAQSVAAGFENAARSPKGAQVLDSFNQARTPAIGAVGRDIVDSIGPGIDPVAGAAAAQDAIDTVHAGFRTAAQPDYDAAARVRVPAKSIPNRTGYTGQAIKDVAKDKGLMHGLTLDNRGVAPNPRSVLYLDAVKKQLDDQVTQFSRNSPSRTSFAAREAGDLTGVLDAAAPTYGRARGIVAQGRNATDALEAGPLGRIVQQPTTAGQASSLFGATNRVDQAAAEEAMRHLPANVPLGLLANQLDSTLTKNPLDFARKALPNEVSRELADTAITNAGRQSVREPLRALGAVSRRGQNAVDHENTGPMGYVWSHLRDLGRGSVVRNLTEPESILKLNKAGVGQDATTAAGRGTVYSAMQERKRKRRKAKRRSSSED